MSFNTQPPEGGWVKFDGEELELMVSTHSRLKAAGVAFLFPVQSFAVSTHSRLKAAGDIGWDDTKIVDVSTHSRLKAAGSVGVSNWL